MDAFTSKSVKKRGVKIWGSAHLRQTRRLHRADM